ncbi:chaperonin 10-like protein [Aspergillus unguis]
MRPDSLLVRPVAVALNPTDWKSVSYGRATDGCIVGCDYAGVVEAVGDQVTKPWKVGDRVFGCGHGANLVNPDDGVFGEYAVVKGDLQMRIPDGWTFEKAATVPLGLITVGQGLFQKSLKLRLPDVNGTPEKQANPVLIYGGTTATATLAIQLAKLAGYTVITTCLPDSFAHTKALGADFSFDYTDPEVGAKIREVTDNKLQHAWDTISIPSSAQICADSLSSDSRLSLRYGNLLPVKSPREEVETITTVMYTVFGKFFKFGDRDMPASEEDLEFGRKFYALGEGLMAKGKLRTHPEQVGEGGLDGVIKGFEMLEAGKVMGQKLVYRVGDTVD